MIRIRIDKKERCRGDYSLFVSFDFDMNIVDILRGYPVRYYNADTHEWELPERDLEYLKTDFKDYSVTIDDRRVNTNENEKHSTVSLKTSDKSISQILESYEFKTKPFEHQLEGVKYGLQHKRWLLADEQGCVSGESKVKIKEDGKPATRNIKIRNLKSAFDRDKTIKIKSLVNGRFAYMPIKAVVDKGIQETIQLTLEDTSIQCTPDHLIYTENGWVEADKIKVGDKVFTNGIAACPMCGTTQNLITKYSKFSGYCKSCMYKSRNGTKYNELTKKVDKFGYVRLFGIATRDMPNYDKVHGMGIYEHHQVWYENTGHIVDSSKEVVHHKNGIKTDNRFENLQLLTIQEHDKLHSDTNTNHLYQFNKNLDYIEKNGTKIYLVPRLQEVKSKTHVGEQRVWDIAIDDDTIHNFICNNIVVHNCGKTKETIDTACIYKKEFGYKHCLIICGVNGLKWNWQNEVEKHSNEKGYIIGQRTARTGKVVIKGAKEKIEDLDRIHELPYFIITNIESLRNKDILARVTKLCKKGEINMCAFDEAHKAKNPTSQQGKAFLKVDCDYKIALTGTPLMNTPLDLYTILKWLGYEEHPFYAFKNHYCIMGGFGGYEVVGYKNIKDIHDTLDNMMLRRLKTEVLDLPEKLFVDEYVEMTPKQEVIYKEVTNQVKANIDQIMISPNPLANLIRLRQATGYTGILSSQIKESAKLDRMEELVEEAVANGRKVVIFSNWTQMTDAVMRRLGKKYKGVVITGETNDAMRMFNVNEFQNNDKCKFIVGTIGAMGTGLTLTAGTVEIFLDEPWNRALLDQAVDRCHRVGTTESITIYTLMCKNTIDERIHEIVERKGAMSDAIVDGKISVDKKELIKFLLN